MFSEGVVKPVSPTSRGMPPAMVSYQSTVSPKGTDSILVNFTPSASPGDFTVYCSNLCGDGAPSLPYHVEVYPPPVSDAGQDDTICQGSGYTVTHASASNYVSLKWITTGLGFVTGDTTLSPTYLPDPAETGPVELEMIAYGLANCGNDTSAMILMIQSKPAADAGPSLVTCELEPAAINGSGASGYTSLLWSSTGAGTFSDPTVLHPVYAPGASDTITGTVNLILVAAGPEPCLPDTSITTLILTKQPSVDAGPDTTICENIFYKAFASYAFNFGSLEWNTSGNGIFSDIHELHPDYTPGQQDIDHGSVTLILKANPLGTCQERFDSLILYLEKKPVVDAGEDQEILRDSAAILQGLATGGSGSFSIGWYPSALVLDPGSLHTSTIPLSKDVTLYLEVADLKSGCNSVDSVRIKVLPPPGPPGDDCILIYNVITPNGDGVNDTWIIDCIESYPDNTVRIFNRWGDLIIRFDHYDNTTNIWKGTNAKGDLLPDGTYYYIVTINKVGTKTGWVFVRGGLK